jgi:NADH-quinone oxidoreductase subunit L
MHWVPGGVGALPIPAALIFAAPVLALLTGFFVTRPRAPRLTHVPILASCAVIGLCSVWMACRVYFFGEGFDLPLGDWMVAGEWSIQFGLRLDGLSASVLAMVGVVGGLIHVYASGYMAEEPGFSRFFLAFHLFFFAMIGLILSNNFVQLYLFWELTGLASFLLIGHWHHKRSARDAAYQAFMTNRVADFGLMLAVLVMLSMFRHTRYALMFPALHAADPALLSLVAVLLFWAACGKSAQFPLYFWLPDAMEGPTPVSALMHAATMVTAGVFLLARSWPLISAIGNLPGLIAAVGAFTAVFAGVLAGSRRDLKRILAYSTVSHLGLMTFGLGLGQPAAAVFHLITHGFFKAVLFLCAGNIAHALHQPTASVDEVGGLRRAMPVTFVCFLVAALSLAGFWPLAGFYSKDAIVGAALEAGGWRAAAGLGVAVVSAFYIFRMLFLAFFGPSPRQHGPEHFHEAPPACAVPVLFLAAGAASVGWLHHGFSQMFAAGWPVRSGVPGLPELHLSHAALSTGAAVVGAALAYAATLGSPEWDWSWRERRPGLEAWLDSDLGVKRVVGLTGYAFRGLANGVGRTFDKKLWDGFLEWTARAARGLGGVGAELSTGSLNDYLWWMLMGAAALVWSASRLGVAR